MEDSKKWYKSKGVMGSFVVLIAIALNAFGFEMDTEAQEQLLEGVLSLVATFGGLLALVGRVKATKDIK